MFLFYLMMFYVRHKVCLRALKVVNFVTKIVVESSKLKVGKIIFMICDITIVSCIPNPDEFSPFLSLLDFCH